MLGTPGARVIPRNESLDGLRGIAIAAVMLFHLGLQWRPTTLADQIAQRLTTLGWAGVDLFFVLSGYLITTILIEARGSAHYYRNFYGRRALRIFPLYYAFLAVVGAAGLAGWRPAALASVHSAPSWYWLYSSNILAAIHGFDARSATDHFWSLAIEEQFYLLWPAVVAVAGPARLPRVCLAFVAIGVSLRLILLAAGLGPISAYVLMPSRIDALASGALVAAALQVPEWRTRLRTWAPLAFGLSVCALVLLAAVRHAIAFWDPWTAGAGFLSLDFIFAVGLFTLLCAPQGLCARLLCASLLTSLGRYSYAIYLFHWPVLKLALAGRSHFPLLKTLGTESPAFGVVAVLFLGIMLGIGWLSWQGFEGRFNSLKRHLPYRSVAD